ncbi:hypothetical protein VOLCADRAFT_97478 [Volvox carteri f. nagariensis]|uniref:Uncharacterized protein n=1 Tax=Volvox carteri f. nagariensis TaxID=3068 RepID=D8UCV0_VOLCA|nr:uncharacterized protein VOLCADRAFT_97478 [Volvox carteri f. nagariensis]EFJ42454.1 hypothetical protein VOLCADRAFT_97478 [Volvox carteri f. nagariensis]|eukprot:XP_002956517.1 hypothetical protein VOLCADRAFT_97478 [Volvox carteri f. nagariensis]
MCSLHAPLIKLDGTKALCSAQRARRPKGLELSAPGKPGVKEALGQLKQGLAGKPTVDPAYLAGAAYLKTIGFTNQAEVARVLDVAMNPDSLFLSYGDGRRTKNASARKLDVDADMRPVVDFLLSRGVSVGEIAKVISGHPPVLSYSVPDRLEPFWDYLTSVGVANVAQAVINRPSLLGLEVDANLRKIVEYLQYTETPPETIVKYVLESI